MKIVRALPRLDIVVGGKTMRKALVCLLLALACTAHAETVTGRVVGVADGDTITVLDADKVQHKIWRGSKSNVFG